MKCRIALIASLLLASFPAASALAADAIAVDKEKKTVTIPAKIAPRKLPQYDQVYPIEVVASWAHDRTPIKGQKAHETVVTFDVLPSEVHKALEGLGLKPGKPAIGEGTKAEGPEVRIYIEVPATDGGEARRLPLERCLVDKRTGKTLGKRKWIFTGSAMTQPDPEKDEKVYGADLTGTLIGVFPVTNQTVIQTDLTMKEEPLLKMETNKKVLPPEGTAVKLIIEVPAA